MQTFAKTVLAGGLLAGLMGPALAGDALPPGKTKGCFFSNQFQSWKAPDDRTMYIRVGMNRYFRLDMAGSCRAMKGINPHLVTTFHGSNSVCTALDWDLKVVDSPGGISTPCIVKTMTELTPKEVAAIPKKFKP